MTGAPALRNGYELVDELPQQSLRS